MLTKINDDLGGTNVSLAMSNKTLKYNLSGDITTLVRRDSNAGSYAEIDNLAYTYPSIDTFRLSSVTETSYGTLGFTIKCGFPCDPFALVFARAIQRVVRHSKGDLPPIG